MNRLVWTRERPTEPGWYWYRCTDRFSGTVRTMIARIDLDYVDPVFLVTEFAGPIPEPEESRS